MLVIPAIDLLGGRTVRLLRGDYSKVTEYDADPAELLQSFVDAGARRVHLVDLDAARGQGDNREAIGRLVRKGLVDVEVGGGVRSPEAVESLLSAGAAFVVVGTVAAERPGNVAAWAVRWPGRIYVGVDARDGRVATHGWEQSGGLEVADMLDRYRDAPVAGIIYTDIGRDGALQGAATGGLAEVVDRAGHDVVLAGGVTSRADIVAAREAGTAGVIVGKALYEGRLSVTEAIAAAQGA